MCDKKKKNKKKKKKKKKTKKLSQFLKSHISGTREAISLKFGMWSAAVGGNVHSKNRLVSSRKHRATEVRKLRFLSSCQYTHGCYAPASWAARHTTVCLDLIKFRLLIIIVTVVTDVNYVYTIKHKKSNIVMHMILYRDGYGNMFVIIATCIHFSEHLNLSSGDI